MKYLKSYNESINIFRNLKIKNICRKYGIKNYTINEDGTIDVNGNVYLNVSKLTKLPLKFRNITGNFSFSVNLLSSLEGCPESIGLDFDCSYNQLTSLEGCPKLVGGDFSCYKNNVVTFEHLPLSIGGSFYCVSNPIYEVWKLFEDYSKIEFLNDCDALREPDENSEEPIIILDRLNYFLEEIGKKTVTKVKGYKCI